MTSLGHLTGHCLMESDGGGYVMAVDDGTLTVGPPRPYDDQPEATEILSVVKVGDKKVALKSAYGRYLSVSPDGEIVARTEAMGVLELWEPLLLDTVSGCFC